jgi:cyclophilin family peptidyl-prolyl cis-trans isomerase
VETLNWEAPVTVDNFLQYVEASFYNNVAFHRAIDGFLIQTGLWELLPGGTTVAQKPPRDPIRNESRYSVSNARGTLSMSRNADPDSANAQFFINQGNNDFLDYGSISNPDGFAVFARIIRGLDVVDSIAGLPTGNVFGIGSDVPLTIVLIQSTVIGGE